MSLRATFDQTLQAQKTELSDRDRELIAVVKATVDYVRQDGNFSARLDTNGLFDNTYIVQMGAHGARTTQPLFLTQDDVAKAYDNAAGDTKTAAADLAEVLVNRLATRLAEARLNSARNAALQN